MPVLETLTDHSSRAAADAITTRRSALETLVTVFRRPIQFVSFWVAAILPLTYLPLLATGVVAEYPTTFLAVLCVNILAFVLGHGHRCGDVI